MRAAAPLVLALVVAGAAGSIAALSGRLPTHAVADLAVTLSTRVDAPVVDLQIVPGGEAPWGLGEPVQIWLTATVGARAELFHVTARRQGDRVALVGTPTRLTRTPFTQEELLAARPEAALIALRVGADVQTVAVQPIEGEPLLIVLDTPATRLDGRLTADAAELTAEDATLKVSLADGRVEPEAAAITARAPAGPSAPVMRGIEAGPKAPAGDAATPAQPAGWPAWRAVEHGWRVESPAGLQLWALDTRQVELRYVPGLVTPGGRYGRPGSGRLDLPIIGWIAADGPGGAAADGIQLAPLSRGGAAIRIARSEARIGPFAGEPAPPPTGALRQTGPPLVLDGNPVDCVADEARARTGLGATRGGLVIAAWGASVTRSALGRALAAAGAHHAVELGSGGFAPGGTAAAPGMLDDWASPHLHERLALVPRRGLDAPAWRRAGWRALADGRLAIKRLDAVELTLIDPAQFHASLVPGVAELGGAAERPAKGWWLTGGVRSARAPYGLKIGADVRRAPRAGVMGLRIDARGRLDVAIIDGTVPVDVSLLQGPSLIRNGRKSIAPARVDPGPLAALGRRADGLLVYASSSAGPDALADALLAMDVVDALRLSNRGTADAGQVTQGARTAFGAAASPAPLAGTAVHLLPAAGAPSVRAVQALRPR